jgi:hypothetical protein
MYKFIVAFLLFFQVAFAQIQINKQDFTVSQNSFVIAYDTVPHKVKNITSTGYLSINLDSLKDFFTDTIKFLNPDSSLLSDFQNSNLVEYSTLHQKHTFLNNSTAELALLGTKTSNTLEKYLPNNKLIVYPSLFTTKDTQEVHIVKVLDTSIVVQNITIDSIKTITKTTKYTSNSSYGNLKLPNGEYATLNTIITENSTDSVFVYSNNAWTFLTQGFLQNYSPVLQYSKKRLYSMSQDKGYFLLQATIVNDSIIDHCKWLKYSILNSLPKSENISQALSIFPNPTFGNKLNILKNYSAIVNFEVSDVLGNIHTTGSTNNSLFQQNLENMPNGIYFIHFYESISNKKIISIKFLKN